MAECPKPSTSLSVNAEVKLILTVFIRFYRRHIWLFLLFVFGLSLGSALLGSIQGLNQEATQRYDQTSALVNNPISHFIRPNQGSETLSFDVWRQLRSAGFISAEPVVEGLLTLASGKRVWLKGVNTLQWITPRQEKASRSQSGSMQFGFNTIYISEKLANRLAVGEQQTLTINGTMFKLAVLPKLSGNTALTDIALADHLLNLSGQISYIEVSNAELNELKVKQLLGNKAQLQSAQAQSFDSLSQAFFFNLQALALLGYIVGAFLSFNAIKLSLHARHKLHQQLTLLGCIQANVITALIIEVLLLSLVAALVGAGIAYIGANLLVNEITVALQSLFELDRSLPVQFSWLVVLQAFTLNVLVLTGVACSQLKLFSMKVRLFHKLLLLIGLSYIAGYLYLTSDTPIHALGLCACLLLAFFIITPMILRAVFSVIPTQHPLLKWIKADSDEQIRVLAISVYAVLLAVGTSVGLQIMVSSFSTALQIHLNGRLSAELYVRPNDVTDAQYQWLAHHKNVKTLGVFWQAQANYQSGNLGDSNRSARVISFGNEPALHQNLTLLSGESPSISTLFFDETNNLSGCLANEPSKLLHNVELGQLVTLYQGERYIRCKITGFYYDYGEQRPVFVVVTQAIEQAMFQYQALGFSLGLKANVDEALFKQQLIQHFNLNDSHVVQNQVFKRYATRLFEHTFYATKALNLMIVAIALFGLWVSLLTLGVKQIQPLALLKSLGVTTVQAFTIKLVQSSIILLVTLLLAILLGGLLGWVLLKFVMPIGFGWTIPLLLPFQDILVFIVLIYVLALLVSVAPLLKLSRYAVADLLYEE
ncbi:FtsX-like permease family protein [Pseudoalteromonas piscicida]|uniref:ABC transporter permease n=1 Tax=Pseudoalteromonas piscicida TaxID=43662 RepID=A0A2A5JUH2_PSEO7|nr:FtsX-like permease family protein [Pseudoalteromonas piscicida]PCK32979.1 ABC transporter permease [Pseudoalteromonas piscicida]